MRQQKEDYFNQNNLLLLHNECGLNIKIFLKEKATKHQIKLQQILKIRGQAEKQHIYIFEKIGAPDQLLSLIFFPQNNYVFIKEDMARWEMITEFYQNHFFPKIEAIRFQYGDIKETNSIYIIAPWPDLRRYKIQKQNYFQSGNARFHFGLAFYYNIMSSFEVKHFNFVKLNDPCFKIEKLASTLESQKVNLQVRKNFDLFYKYYLKHKAMLCERDVFYLPAAATVENLFCYRNTCAYIPYLNYSEIGDIWQYYQKIINRFLNVSKSEACGLIDYLFFCDVPEHFFICYHLYSGIDLFGQLEHFAKLTPKEQDDLKVQLNGFVKECKNFKRVIPSWYKKVKR